MTQSRSFKDLVVWQKALVLAKAVYRASEHLPLTEKYGLSSQLCRSAVSIASNIAEGAKRGSKKDFLQFLRIASGSAAELETQLYIASDIYPSDSWKEVQQLLIEVQKMLTVFIRTMR